MKKQIHYFSFPIAVFSMALISFFLPFSSSVITETGKATKTLYFFGFQFVEIRFLYLLPFLFLFSLTLTLSLRNKGSILLVLCTYFAYLYFLANLFFSGALIMNTEEFTWYMRNVAPSFTWGVYLNLSLMTILFTHLIIHAYKKYIFFKEKSIGL